MYTQKVMNFRVHWCNPSCVQKQFDARIENYIQSRHGESRQSYAPKCSSLLSIKKMYSTDEC